MNLTPSAPLAVSSEELTLLAELLDIEEAKLLVGIRHTFRREYRDELRRRLDLVQKLRQRVSKPS